MPQIYDNMIDLIGKTPLLKLYRLTSGLGANVTAKLESVNSILRTINKPTATGQGG